MKIKEVEIKGMKIEYMESKEVEKSKDNWGRRCEKYRPKKKIMANLLNSEG